MVSAERQDETHEKQEQPSARLRGSSADAERHPECRRLRVLTGLTVKAVGIAGARQVARLLRRH